MSTPTPTLAHAEGMRVALMRTASEMGRAQLADLDLEGDPSHRRLVQTMYAWEAREAMGPCAVCGMVAPHWH